jgi:hypothetical protein
MFHAESLKLKQFINPTLQTGTLNEILNILGRMQVMFQMYKQENENLQESAKICFLLDSVEAPNLQAAITSLQFRHTMGTLIYASAKNSLMSTLARSSDYMQNEGRNIAATSIAANRNRNKFP